MPRSPRTAVVVTLLVVTATLLPAAGLAAGGPGDGESGTVSSVAGQGSISYDATIRVHRVSNDTDPRNLPDDVGIDEPSDPVVVLGDRLVISVQSRAFAANVSTAPGSNLTERFVATQRNGSRLWVIQMNVVQGADAPVVDLADVANVTVVEGDGPATYHVVVDTWAVEMVSADLEDGDVRDCDRCRGLRPGKEFYVGFDASGNGQNRLFRFAGIDIDVPTGQSDETVQLPSVPDATVSGRAVLPPSTSVVVELVNTTTGRVAASDRTAVDPVVEGEWTDFSTSLNLASVRGDEFELRVRADSTAVSESVPAAVTPVEASLAFPDDTTRWETTVENATLTHGGFVVVHEAGDPDTVVGVSSYVPLGTDAEQVGVDFSTPVEKRSTFVAVAYRDVNRDGEFDEPDEPYRANGEPVTATAVLEPPEETMTAETLPPPTTSTDEREDTATTPTVGMADRTPRAEDDSIPGFGALGTLAALCALAALAARHR